MSPPDQKSVISIGNFTRVLAVGGCEALGISAISESMSLLDKFCRCLEQAGYPVCGQALGSTKTTSREGIALMSSSAIEADILLLNFGHRESKISPIARGKFPYVPELPAKGTRCNHLILSKHRSSSPSPHRVTAGLPVVPLVEFRANVQGMIELARQANPRVWVLLWGSPPVLHDAQHYEQLLKYNAELHDIASRMGAAYLPTKPIIDNLKFRNPLLGNLPLSEAATSSIAAEIAHVYLSQKQRTAA